MDVHPTQKLFFCQANLALAMLLSTILLSCQTGCHLLNRFRSDTAATIPVAFDEMPTKEQIVSHLVSQSQQIKQIQSDVRVSMDSMPKLRGTLAVEKPNRLRLTAGLLGVSELGVDVGSNAERFWFWTKVAAPGQEPGIYYANHDDYRNSQFHQMVPIEPNWLIDALGFVEFRPTDRIEGPFRRPQDNNLEIRTYRQVGSKQTIRVSVIDPTYGWVSQQSIYDDSGQLIAFANSNKYRHYAEFNVNLPDQVVLTAYSPDRSKLTIVIDASSYKLNSIYGDPEKLWSMPNPGNVRIFNLATGQLQADPQISTGRISDGRTFDHRTSSDSRDPLNRELR